MVTKRPVAENSTFIQQTEEMSMRSACQGHLCHWYGPCVSCWVSSDLAAALRVPDCRVSRRTEGLGCDAGFGLLFGACYLPECCCQGFTFSKMSAG